MAKYKETLAESEAFLAEHRARRRQMELRIKELNQEIMNKAFEAIMKITEGESATAAEGFSLPRGACLEHLVDEHHDSSQETP